MREDKEMILYRAELRADELGLEVIYREYYPCHESPEFWYCTTRREAGALNPYGIERYRDIKSSKWRKLYRIHKTSGRFAHSTKESALDHLRFRKQKQIRHLNRDLAFAKAFLEGEIDPVPGIVKGTKELVHDHYVFD